MTNTLSTLRADLQAVLAGQGLNAASFLPERPVPPIVLVSPGEPYVVRGDTFGHHTAALTLVLLTETATNETATEALDEMIVRVAIAVADSEFIMGRVTAPAAFKVGTATYLGCTVDVERTGYLEVTP